MSGGNPLEPLLATYRNLQKEVGKLQNSQTQATTQICENEMVLKVWSCTCKPTPSRCACQSQPRYNGAQAEPCRSGPHQLRVCGPLHCPLM